LASATAFLNACSPHQVSQTLPSEKTTRNDAVIGMRPTALRNASHFSLKGDLLERAHSTSPAGLSKFRRIEVGDPNFY
jgi:hypothetical protein